MLVKTVAFVAITLAALVVGVLWGTWLSLSRSIETFSAELFLQIGQKMIKNLAVPMRVLMLSMVIANALLCYLLFHDGNQAAGFVAVGGLVLLASVVVVTVSLNVPIDLQIRQWTQDALPSNWQAIRRRWERFHQLRTVLAIGGFCLVVVAVLMRS